MTRVAFMMRLKAGGEEEYKARHDDIWPEMIEMIRASGARNYTIFRAGLDLVAYLEVDSTQPRIDNDQAVVRKWWTALEPIMEYEPDHSPVMRPMIEVFHLD
jgi:L-rhamnose mutarotase